MQLEQLFHHQNVATTNSSSNMMLIAYLPIVVASLQPRVML